MSNSATTSSINGNGETTPPRTEFPIRGMMPRADTQAGDFVRKYPNYDGRGTVVAILDTGIDPGAVGLKVTSDGKRKVLDFIDCTGSGDVIMSEPVKSEGEELEIKGVSGRTLKLNPQWQNPTGEWRVGSKMLFDIVPSEVKRSVQSEREEHFRKRAQAISDSVSTKVAALSKDGNKEDKAESELRAELDAQTSILSNLDNGYADKGPFLDCVTFHDGEQWRAVIDTSETGDLSDAPALGAYKHTGDVALLCKRQLLSYTLNFYDGGRVLNIVTSAGSHSTHVAGIVAANHPDESQNNGVAPGAQLVSLLIGDHRVGSLETGLGVTRAANAIVEHNVDLANMSFGEPSATSNIGQWVQLIRDEVVNKNHCVFIASAGNEGPAMSTAGSPGGTSDGFIGVGAYVGYEQMKAEYPMYDIVKDTIFTWCSRGPAADGSRGVDIYAPGSAIASYPAYTQQRMRLANGTSMSSPNLCGCLALLVSAWKQEYCRGEVTDGSSSSKKQTKISPYRIKNAIMSTAKPFGDELGAGLIQTDDAWQFLKKNAERIFEDIEYVIKVQDSIKSRGIYLRNAEDSACPRHMQVNVVPVFPGDRRAKLEYDEDGSHGETQSQAKFDYEQRVTLVSSVSWVKVPESLYINSDGRVFNVKVDATQLAPGHLHVAVVQGYDSMNVDRGPIFTVPVTVTKPLDVGDAACVRFNDLSFKPTDITRKFVAVPYGATRAHITVRATNASKTQSAPAMFYLHCLQLAPQERFTKYEKKTWITIGHPSYVSGGGGAEQTYVSSMEVIGGKTLEVCVASFWNQLDMHEADVSVAFNGILPAGAEYVKTEDSHMSSSVVVNGNYGVARTDFSATVRPEYNVQPSATLQTLRKSLRPVESTIAPSGSERDIHLTTGVPTQKLVLDYRLETKSDNTSIRLRMPSVDTQIYEAWMEDFAVAVFDANKQRVAVFISYTKSFTLKKKGDYLVRVQIRHRNSKDLEALKNVPLLVDYSLSKKIKLSTTSSLAGTMTKTIDGASPAIGNISKGTRMPLFFKTELGSELPSEAAPGDVLYGTMSVNKRSSDLALEYIVPSKIISKSDNSGKEEEEIARNRKGLEEAIRKLRLEWIEKLQDEEERDALVAEEMVSNNAEKAEILSAQLSALDKERKKMPWDAGSKLDKKERVDRVMGIAEQVIELTQEQALRARLYEEGGDVKTDEEDKKQKKQADKAKGQLKDALISKCRGLGSLVTTFDSGSEASEEYVKVKDDAVLEAYEKAVRELGRWTDKKQQKESAEYLVATVGLYMAKQQHGRALQRVLKWLEQAPLSNANSKERKEMRELRDALLVELQWTVWGDHFKAVGLAENPKSYEEI